jgi:cyclopropane fatty-acyl-phospholipid synthase-like methyltransferase
MVPELGVTQSITGHVNSLAQMLGMSKEKICLDLDCETGFVMRQIHRFSEAEIVGLTQGEETTRECLDIIKAQNLQDSCSVIKVWLTKSGLI